VNSIATIAISSVVTTWPSAFTLTTPKGDIGAVGWTSTMP
jgi:hypothetical protein